MLNTRYQVSTIWRLLQQHCNVGEMEAGFGYESALYNTYTAERRRWRRQTEHPADPGWNSGWESGSRRCRSAATFHSTGPCRPGMQAVVAQPTSSASPPQELQKTRRQKQQLDRITRKQNKNNAK